MNKEIICVNENFFDYKRYIREVEWLRYDVKRKITDMLEKNFIVLEEFEEKYDRLKMVFYNKRLDIRIEIECLKQSPEKFA